MKNNFIKLIIVIIFQKKKLIFLPIFKIDLKNALKAILYIPKFHQFL